MRVLVYVQHYTDTLRGGAEVMLEEVVEYLRSCGDEVTVISGGTPRDAIEETGRVKYDVILSQMGYTSGARSIARIRGLKFVQIMHNNRYDSIEQVKNGADLTVFNAEWLRSDMGGSGPVLHPVVRREKHATTPGDCITLVNLIPEKGAVLFYQLAALRPDLKFMGVMGGYGRQLSNVPGVELVGNTPFMKEEVWSKTRVLLMPSTYESYGMAAVEAMCSGIPVIATDTPGLREATDGAAMLMDTRCPHNWTAALDSVLGNWDTWSERSLSRAARLNTDAELAEVRKCILSVL